jgi:hypothetical protein
VILFHLANVLYLASYAVRDILWLRLITVLGGLTLLASFLVQPAPPWPAVTWNLLFFIINVVRIHLLLLERRPVPLDADEQHLANLVFRGLRPRELLRLLRAGRFLDHGAGAPLIRRSEPLAHLLLVVRGRARVERADQPPIEIGEGTFIGELCYLTGKPPGADVIASAPVRVVQWPTAELRALLEANPELHVVMQQVLGSDLATKLRGPS